MISTSQKEHLTYTAIGQVLIIVGAIIVIFSYVVPWFKTIDSRLQAANEVIQDFKTTEANGLSFEQLSKVLSAMKGKEELIAIINAAPANEVRQVIKKEGTDKYLNWLREAISKSDDDRRKLVQIKQKINSILPTLSPMSSNIDEENITLKQYIRFIEGSILKEFNFDSNVVLGLQWINYGDGKWAVPKSIGTFDLSFDFDSTNGNILKFLNYINNSGNGEILSQSGNLTLPEDNPGIMSNPLITIESFSLTDSLDAAKPNEKNSGRTTIRFYVRGSSKDDIVYLSESVKTRKTTLKKKIDNTVEQCKVNNVLCGNLDLLISFQSKYNEFLKSTEGIVTTWGSDTIEKLSQQVTSLRGLEKELEDIAPTINTPTN